MQNVAVSKFLFLQELKNISLPSRPVSWFAKRLEKFWQLLSKDRLPSIKSMLQILGNNRLTLGLTNVEYLRPLAHLVKVEKISKGSLDSIPSPSPSVKIQIMGGKVCHMCKGKTLLVIVNKVLKTKSLLTSPYNVLLYYLK